MKYLFNFFLVFLFAFPTYIFAQKDTLAGKDYIELTKLIKAQSKDTTQGFALLKYYQTKAQKEQNLEREFEALITYSAIYFENELFEKAAEKMDQVLLFRSRNDLIAQKERTYKTAMLVYLRSGHIKKTYAAIDSTLVIADKTNDLKLRLSANQMMELLDGMGGNYRLTITRTKQNLKNLNNPDLKQLSSESKNQQLLLNQSILANAYLRLKIADSSVIYLNELLQNPIVRNDSCIIKITYLQLAEAEILLKNYSTANKNVSKAKQYCQPFSKMDSLLLGGLLGRMYLQQEDYEKSIVALENAFKTYEINEQEEAFTLDYYKILAEAYKGKDNLEKANFYFQKYVNASEKFGSVRDTIQRGKQIREINQFKNVLEFLKKEKEGKQSNFNYLLLGGSIVILILLFILLKFYRNKKANEIKFDALLAKIKAAENPENIIDTKDEVLEETNSTDVSEEVTNHILDGLKKLEEKEYFLKQECNSYNVAKKIGTNTSYLSKVINSHFGKNFNTYINDLRINYVIIRLKNDVIFRSYSIQSIAEEVGYKSADSFTKYFKKDTGLNPSFYIKEIKNVA
ncbi:helix-turn-helix domain-containing protein [Aequorivita capsosiphonis]|uniref:helix-turn-helix domain-containing protein n=1 Tax=Aequorivita capsosiphonis TaxID=487317 RepID=UPI0012F7C76F|nr:helix-turn-helix domain-containing protein [Aequorivita capsosiphonis]